MTKTSRTIAALDAASVGEYCRTLRLPTVGAQFARLAADAAAANQSHTSYLAALLAAEVEERERGTIERRLRDAKLPRMKTLDEFDFAAAPHIPATLVRELSDGGYMTRAEPVIFIGDSGTG